jgi:hypothetical protein
VETKAETIKQGLEVQGRDVVVCVQLTGRRRSAPSK